MTNKVKLLLNRLGLIRRIGKCQDCVFFNKDFSTQSIEGKSSCLNKHESLECGTGYCYVKKPTLG